MRSWVTNPSELQAGTGERDQHHPPEAVAAAELERLGDLARPLVDGADRRQPRDHPLGEVEEAAAEDVGGEQAEQVEPEQEQQQADAGEGETEQVPGDRPKPAVEQLEHEAPEEDGHDQRESDQEADQEAGPEVVTEAVPGLTAPPVAAEAAKERVPGAVPLPHGAMIQHSRGRQPAPSAGWRLGPPRAKMTDRR